MASAEGSESSTKTTVVIILRSPDPSKLKDLQLTVPLRWRVEALKQLIASEHPRKPLPKDQVLIYGGKVLVDGDGVLEKVLGYSHGDEGPYILHLALRGEESLSQSASAPDLSAIEQESTTMRRQPTSVAATPQPSPMMALPIVMMNPVVSAAYNAAWAAAAYNPDISAGQGPSTSASASLLLSPMSNRIQGIAGASSSATANALQNQPMVPAIAFFPLGIPVLVPTAAAQTQGFQVGQTVQQQTQVQVQNRQQQRPRHIRQRPDVAAPLGRRHAHGGNVPQARGRGVVVYRFSLRGLVQLALIIAVLYAYCSREKFILGVAAFVFLYLFARPIRRLILQYIHARDADGRQRPRGILYEILAILLTLISSLFPNWNANEGQGVPFARMVREDVPEDENRVADAEQNHPHVD